jgi:ABC-type multidrug transport system fused ATPase/permease subunit
MVSLLVSRVKLVVILPYLEVLIMFLFRTDHEDDISNTQFLQVSCAIVGLNVLFTLSRSFSFAYGGLQAARYLYHQLTKSTLNTFMHFFETQSLGRLLNRFGRDTDCIDEDLPFMLNIVLAQVCSIILDC